MPLTGTRTFTDYTEAERFADQWAGDTRECAAVVEDFDANVLPRLLNILSKKFAKNNCLVISLHPGQEFTVCDIKR